MRCVKAKGLVHVNLARGFRGGERQTQLLVESLSKRGIPQVLVGRAGEPLLDRCDYPQVQRVAVSHFMFGHWHRLGGLIHAHEAKGVYWSWIHQKIWRTPYLLTRRVPFPVRHGYLNLSAYRGAVAHVGVSRVVAAALESQLEQSVGVILDSCSCAQPNRDEVRLLKQRLGPGPVIGHVGALIDGNKGQSTLIRAFKKIPNPNARLLLVGEGKDRPVLEALAADDPRVLFVGFQNNVIDYLAAMDLFAFPSNAEALGSVLLDVMATGVPIVASDVGGIPEVIGEDRGLLVPAGDVTALSKAIVRLLESPSLCEQCVSKARIFAQAHGPEQMADAYCALYARHAPTLFS